MILLVDSQGSDQTRRMGMCLNTHFHMAQLKWLFWLNLINEPKSIRLRVLMILSQEG